MVMLQGCHITVGANVDAISRDREDCNSRVCEDIPHRANEDVICHVFFFFNLQVLSFSSLLSLRAVSNDQRDE